MLPAKRSDYGEQAHQQSCPRTGLAAVLVRKGDCLATGETGFVGTEITSEITTKRGRTIRWRQRKGRISWECCWLVQMGSWLHAQGWGWLHPIPIPLLQQFTSRRVPRPTDPRNHGDEVYRAQLFNCRATRLTDIRTESPLISWCPASRLAARSHATTSASLHLELCRHKNHSPPASLSSYRLPAPLRVTSSFGCGEHPDSMACPTWSPFPSKRRRAGKGKS